MGKNSKAKRDAKVKAARRRGPSTGSRSSGSSGSSVSYSVSRIGPGDLGSAPGSLFRSSCSECGSTRLSWMTPVELADQVPADTKARVEEGMEFFGPEGEAWLCEDCGGFGLMG